MAHIIVPWIASVPITPFCVWKPEATKLADDASIFHLYAPLPFTLFWSANERACLNAQNNLFSIGLPCPSRITPSMTSFTVNHPQSLLPFTFLFPNHPFAPLCLHTCIHAIFIYFRHASQSSNLSSLFASGLALLSPLVTPFAYGCVVLTLPMRKPVSGLTGFTG